MRYLLLSFPRADAGKLRQELLASLVHGIRQITVIREKEERRRGPELLSHEQHRRSGSQEQHGGQGSIPARTSEGVQAVTAQAVRNLVMVLEKADKGAGRFRGDRWSSGLILPLIALALIQKSPLHR